MVETKHLKPIAYKVYDFLKGFVGEQNAISARDLAAQFALEERQLRDVINAIRNSSELERTIGSSARGYFICKDKEEFERANNILYATAFNLLRTARANERKAGLDGQMKLKLGKFYKEEYEAYGGEQ